MKKIIVVFMIVFATAHSTKAQDGIENILFAQTSDAEKLGGAYLEPFAKGLMYGMNNGWYHTAKVHKTFGFDISIRGNFSAFPSDAETFNVAALGLSSRITANPVTSPTIGGSQNAMANGYQVTIEENSDQNINGGLHPRIQRNFTMADGKQDDFPLKSIPTPVVQLNLGLPADFEVSLRFLPTSSTDDYEAGLFGLGLKKEITNWFGPLDKLPLHVSLMGAFTNMKVNYNIADPSGNEINITDGVTEFKLNSYMVQALASLNFPIINVYGGLGYTGGTSSLKMKGTYVIDYNTLLPNTEKTLIDPINLDYNNAGFRTTLGARLSLGFFKIYGDYTLQEYNTLSLGVAFSLR